MDEDVILKNPARNLQIPQTEVKKRVAMDPEQIKLFMEYVRNSPQYSNTYPEFLFLFNTGVRVGEMAGLTWDNIDFENNVITINKTVNRYRKKDFGFTVALASPKSRTSIRTFPMNDEVRKMFLKEKFRDTPPAAPLPFVDDSGNIRRQVKNIVFSNSFWECLEGTDPKELEKEIIEKSRHYGIEVDPNAIVNDLPPWASGKEWKFSARY